MSITEKEVGILKSIHLSVWHLMEQGESHELRERMRRVWDVLPLSETNGLHPDRRVSEAA